jgi:ubiquitin-activating enzyme E1
MAEAKAVQIDDELYNRQLYVYGHEAQQKMSAANILLVGMNGLGVEVAKNIILAGVKAVTICDPVPTSWNDLASQFYLNESHLGVPRAAACVDSLKDLNPYVSVHLYDGLLTNELVSTFTVVVLIDQELEMQRTICSFCHDRGIAIILGDARGVYGSVFCDFGESFVVSDNNGEVAASSMIAGITRDKHTLVTCLEETPHNLETGDVVVITDVQGSLGGLLNHKQFPVVKKDLYNFEIAVDTTAADAFNHTGGYINQVKQPVIVKFERFENALESPSFNCDVMKFHHAPLLHASWR